MSGVVDCWARRLHLVNSDSGLFISGGFCTVSDLRCELKGSKESKRPQKHPGGFGPASMNLVGLETREKSATEPDGLWFEAIPPQDLRPQNLHQAQWERRIGVMR